MPLMRANGVEHYYEERGAGFPVLMGHSLSFDHEMFLPQIDALSESFRVIAVDFRGHGLSEKVYSEYTLDDICDDIFAIADALKIDRFHWVGLSLGGMVGMRLVLRQGERIANLVLMDTNAEAEEPLQKEQLRIILEHTRQMEDNREVTRNLLGTLMFSHEFLSASEARREAWVDKIVANDNEAIYFSSLAVLERKSVVESLVKIHHPTLVFVGEKDVSTPVEKASLIASAIPNATLHIVPGSGHISSLEAPELINGKLMAFLESEQEG